ncbi:MAG: PAS domain S-box protein [Candidatus Delongbacteria bacterium]|nr:PAS domain S-box protein [Candidatus Delongbacteria bacterium]
MKIPLRVLIIEDVEEDAIQMMLELHRGGYDPEYLRVETAEEMSRALQEQEWDLILADFQLPDFSGPGALKLYKESGLPIPFIVVSGRLSEEAAVDSLKGGAHDFINKHNLARFVPAVKRELADSDLKRERAHMKKALFESETMFETLMDAMSEGVCIVKDHCFINANPSLEKILGVEKGTLVGRTNRDFLKYNKGEIRALREKQLQDGGTGSYELEISRPDGEKRQILLTETPIPTEDEQDKRIFIVAYDITERKLMEERTRDSEARFRDVALSTSDWVWEVDLECRYTYCSDKVVDLLGYTAEEILGRTPFDLMPADEVAPLTKIFNQSAAGKRPIKDLENRSITKDGREIVLLTNAVPMLDEQGELLGYRGLDKDITQRKLTEAALVHRTSDLNARVKELNCQYGISQYLTEADVSLVEILQGIVEKVPSGWTYPERTSVRLIIEGAEFTTENFKETPWRQVATVKHHDRTFGTIEVCFNADGHTQTEDPFLEEEKNLLEVIALRVSSFLERRQITYDLLRSQTRMRAITDTARDAIIMMSSEGNITFWSPGAEQLFGYTGEEVSGRNLHQIIVPPKYHEAHHKAFPRFIATGEGALINQTLEITGIHQDGREIPVELSLSSVLIDDEWQAVGIIRDITERKKAEIELQQANKMESIGTLAAGIAHEINTPTQFVGNNLRFLQDSFGDITKVFDNVNSLLGAGQEKAALSEGIAALERAVEEADLEFLVEEIPTAIQQSQRGIETVARIVSSMRAFAHPGKDEKVPSNLNKIIQDTVTVSRNEWKYVADLEVELAETLPEVQCFPGAFGQVILNLITNAAHAIRTAQEKQQAEGEPESGDGAKGMIRIKTERNNTSAIIQISDSGTGIPPEIQKRVFDPFFTTKDVGKGTGQGLSLAHSVVVENHHGEITFETEMGSGTTFVISLPIEAAKEMEPA